MKSVKGLILQLIKYVIKCHVTDRFMLKFSLVGAVHRGWASAYKVYI